MKCPECDGSGGFVDLKFGGEYVEKYIDIYQTSFYRGC